MKMRLVIFWGLALAALVVSAEAQTLPVTNNVIAWWRADSLSLLDGASVSSWIDSSFQLYQPNNHTASQGTAGNQPIFVTGAINGLPVVRFDGADDFFSIPTVNMPSGSTLFAVFRTTSTDATSGYEGNAPLTILGEAASEVNLGFGVSNGVALFNQYSNGGSDTWRHFSGTNIVNDGKAHLISATRSVVGITSFDALYTELKLESSGSLVDTAPGVNIFNRLAGGFGDRFGGTIDFFDGDLAEVIIYNAALSPVDHQTVGEYLFAKWSIPEPTSIGLLTLAGAIWALRQRARR